MKRICKRCGAPLSKYAIKRVCHACRAGAGALYEIRPPRPHPEIPTGVERSRRRH